MKIPFVDLKSQYLSIKDEIDNAINSVINDCAFIGNSGNKYVKSFESNYASFNNVKHCIACANGTDALEIALKASGVKPGDEVIVPALTWISTAESASNIGAKPVFVDVEEHYYTINSELIEKVITEKTKAIIAVHLYGHPADMQNINEIAKKHNLIVVEDCAQGHGAEINGQKVGTWGDVATFSFFPGKNLGAYGDAGGIVTNNDIIADNCRMISQHGQLNKKHVHAIEGRNSRMDGIQAAILDVKLKYLNQWTKDRILNAKKYSEAINNKNIITPAIKENYKHVFHLYVIKTNNRDELMKKLSEEDVSCAIQYPTALPFLDAYSKRNYSMEDFPVAYDVTQKILSLPIYPELADSDIDKIANIVNNR